MDDRIIQAAIEKFSAIAASDPRSIEWNGAVVPHQVGEAACLLHYAALLEPTLSDALRLAAHCQHLRRFAYPRSEFPEGREGYLNWRLQAGRRSAEEAASILRFVGIPEPLVQKVIAIVTKHDRRHDPDVQTMEDALCLAFFRLDAPAFASKHDLDAVTRIVRRTWAKMSPSAKALALRETFAEPLSQLLAVIAAGSAGPVRSDEPPVGNR